MKLCADVFDTYISNLVKERFRVVGKVFEVLSLRFESGPTVLKILEFDSDLGIQLGMAAPAMGILINDCEDKIELKSMLPVRKAYQTQTIDHLYIFSHSSLSLYTARRRYSENIRDIDETPQTDSLPIDAIEHLTQLVRLGRII